MNVTYPQFERLEDINFNLNHYIDQVNKQLDLLNHILCEIDDQDIEDHK